MSKKILLIISAALILLAGCSGNGKNNQIQKESEQNNNELAEQFQEDDAISKSSGMIGYGFPVDSPNQYVYQGAAIEIAYYIENKGKTGEENAEVGLLLFVNGEPQPYSADEGGKKREEAVMQKFSLSPGEKKELKLSFHPISGKKGENIGIIPATIWNPDFIPESKERPSFGNCLQLGANIPLTIQMKSDGKAVYKLAEADAKMADIPEEILAAYEGAAGEDSYDFLDDSVGFTMEPSEKNTRLLRTENGKADITINLYGGKQVTDKITVFINNEPIQINGGNYVEVDTKKGKMWQIRFSLDVSRYGERSTIYAVAMTSGNDYMVDDIYQTSALLLVNESEYVSEPNTKNSLCPDLDYDLKDDSLVLTNLKTEKEIKRISVEKKENIVATFPWKDGYAVAKQILGREKKVQSKEGVYILPASDEIEKDVKGYELILYDENLNQKKKIELMDIIHQAGREELLNEAPVLNEAGTKLAWLSSGQEVVYIDLQKGDFKKNKNFSRKDIEVDQIGFVGENKLAFAGVRGTSETDICYGYLNLKNGELIAYEEKNYNASTIQTNSRYLCVNDSEDPTTHSSSGRILVLDCETNEQKTFELDNLESTMAMVTEDGKYVIAVKWISDYEFRIRHYDFQTGEKLGEKNFRKKGFIKAEQIRQYDDTYAVIFGSDTGKGIAYEIGID